MFTFDDSWLPRAEYQLAWEETGILGLDEKAPNWPLSARPRNEGPAPLRRWPGVLRAGHFILFQTDGWERFTILAFADEIDDIESTTPLVEYVAPARERISFGYEWFAPGRGGEPIFCPVASQRELHAQRERALLHLHDAAFGAAVAQLGMALAGDRDRDRLKAVGVEALALIADRRRVSKKEVAKRAHVHEREVGDCLWRLGEIDPGLFPAYVDPRTRGLEELFADVPGE
jgi:hypothetical protein